MLAMTPDGGIGLRNSEENYGGMPWPYNKDDMSLFRTKTMDSILIVGRITYESMPKIYNSRIVFDHQ